MSECKNCEKIKFQLIANIQIVSKSNKDEVFNKFLKDLREYKKKNKVKRFTLISEVFDRVINE